MIQSSWIIYMFDWPVAKEQYASDDGLLALTSSIHQ